MGRAEGRSPSAFLLPLGVGVRGLGCPCCVAYMTWAKSVAKVRSACYTLDALRSCCPDDRVERSRREQRPGLVMASVGSKSPDEGSRKPLVVAAIPCFNEERFIGSVVLKAKKYVDKVIVIDDGSSDASVEIASAAGAIVHSHGSNKGYGAAIHTALEKAKEQGADVLVVIDGDGQHDGRDIPRLVKPVLDGEADVVIGSRFLGEARSAPLYRRLGQRVLNLATNVASGRRLSDSQSGFRAYSPKALSALNLTENGMSATSEMQFAIASEGLKVAEIPIEVCYAGKLKRNPLGHGLNVLSRVMVLLSLRQPLVLFGIPGVLLLGGGLVLGLRVLDIYAESQSLALGTLLGAVLLALTGVLALFAALMLQSMKELLRGQWERFERTETEG
jgi:glycosyltransferase involved in cell wall biosynthesis